MSSTPLTYPETLAILRAIQTEPDILANACRTILKKPQLADNCKEDPKEISRHMALFLKDLNADPIASMMAATILAGCLGGHVVKPDSIHKLFNSLARSLAEAFASSLTDRARQLGEDDEAEAVKFLAQILPDVLEGLK